MSNPISDAVNALCFLHEPEAVFEICVIRPKKPTSPLWTGRANGKKATISGWFTDPGTAANLAGQIEAEGVYTTLNPCKEAILARADHRLEAFIDRTADAHIDQIKNLLIDIDPKRPTGTSSTEQEHTAALEMAEFIKADLTKETGSDALVGDSGNGAHLIYPLDLPNTPENVSLIKDVLTALSLRYQDDLAARNLSIDTSVCNPARLTKLYGTWVRKGDNTQNRPHRLARILSLPEARLPVPLELLQKLAGTIPNQEAKIKPQDTGPGEARLDLAAYLAHYGVQVVKEKPHQGGTLFCLETCLFNPEHTGNEAAIFQPADGPLSYQCFHASCQGRTWREARYIISRDDNLAAFMVGGPAYSERARSSSSCTWVCGDLAKSLREGTLSPEQKAYLIELVEKAEKSGQTDNLAADVRQLILSSSGRLMLSDVVKELGLSSLSSNRRFNQNLSKIFERLVKEGLLERLEKRGEFLIVNRVAKEIPWKEVGIPTPVDFKQPLDLHELVYFYSGNVVVVGGTYNAGKTVYCLNTACLNMNHWKVNYLSSEMTPEELAARLYKFKAAGLIQNIDAWDKVSFRHRRENFHQVIDPDGLNIIDYLELTKEFYAVGGMIDKIFQKLNKGIAVIAIQKAPGETHARGGAFTVEKARFAVSIDYQKLKIIKAKNLKPGVKNPTNIVIDFHVADGTKMIRMG